MILFVCPLFGDSNSLGLSSWSLIFLSTIEKCWQRRVFSYRLYSKSFRSSGFCPLFEGARNLECPILGGFTVITKLITARLTVGFIN